MSNLLLRDSRQNTLLIAGRPELSRVQQHLLSKKRNSRNSTADMGTMSTFGLNIHMDHSNLLEQQLQPEHCRLSYGDEPMGMNFAPTEAWQTVPNITHSSVLHGLTCVSRLTIYGKELEFGL
ncbi:uncharacterized protein EAE98_010890 [Botrytis deweyae]|uniref:Uncharacterized protein n=1 Tax=Botrytis deweyae TaxID=2478750 RepID=A0ABQ7I7J2_9HELO|nr:uncharacterized protein EAE98_010890 [Botrytis deweyae]KAF7916035.1 hypothetical protein EAE98_010890 [Botrytis deweyae]